jgi:hypothetical protein
MTSYMDIFVFYNLSSYLRNYSYIVKMYLVHLFDYAW